MIGGTEGGDLIDQGYFRTHGLGPSTRGEVDGLTPDCDLLVWW